MKETNGVKSKKTEVKALLIIPADLNNKVKVFQANNNIGLKKDAIIQILQIFFANTIKSRK